MEKRELFRSFTKRVKAEKRSITPPYLNGSLSLCVDCEAPCIGECETDILFKDTEALIAIDFTQQGCTYCEACADICDKDVLSLGGENVYIKHSVYIDETACVAHHNVMCMSCKEPCIDNAINFDGLFKPIIDPTACTSCGFCLSRCPTSAIKVLI